MTRKLVSMKNSSTSVSHPAGSILQPLPSKILNPHLLFELPLRGLIGWGQAVGLVDEVAEGALQVQGFGGEGAGGPDGADELVP